MNTTTAQASEKDYRSFPENQDLDHIPGSDGLPVIGRMVNIVTDYLGLIDEHHKTWGNVSRLKMFPNRGVMILGADNWKRIMLDQEKNFSAEMGYGDTLGQFYKDGLLLLDFKEHKTHRRVMQTSFKTDAMKTYIDFMAPIVNQHINQWDSEIDFFPKIKETLLDVAARAFIGLNDSEEVEKFNRAFLDINDGLLGVVKKDWPVTAYGRGQRGKRYLLSVFEKLVPERRGGTGTDMLSYMANEKDENDEYYSAEVISKHLIFLLFAAHDTTTGALNHMMYYTAKDPQWQKKMRDECLALGSDISYEQLTDLPMVDYVFQEAQRLHPSVPMMMRRTIRECEFEGFKIPANTTLFLPNPFNHRDSTWWKSPLTFDPTRFAPEREEHKQHPFCYHPFGGGAHKCIGMHFATMLTKVFMFELLTKFEYSLPQGFEPKFEWVPLPRPKSLPIILKAI